MTRQIFSHDDMAEKNTEEIIKTIERRKPFAQTDPAGSPNPALAGQHLLEPTGK